MFLLFNSCQFCGNEVLFRGGLNLLMRLCFLLCLWSTFVSPSVKTPFCVFGHFLFETVACLLPAGLGTSLVFLGFF